MGQCLVFTDSNLLHFSGRFLCELFIWIIETQNHVAWRGPPEVILSRLLLKSHLFSARCLGCVEYLQGWRLHSLLGQPVPMFDHLHDRILFPYVELEFPILQLMASLPLPSTLHL